MSKVLAAQTSLVAKPTLGYAKSFIDMGRLEEFANLVEAQAEVNGWEVKGNDKAIIGAKQMPDGTNNIRYAVLFVNEMGKVVGSCNIWSTGQVNWENMAPIKLPKVTTPEPEQQPS